MLHALDAAISGATGIEIMSPDTDVLNCVRIQRLLPEEGSIYERSH